jgi:DNA repair protein RadA/Sms
MLAAMTRTKSVHACAECGTAHPKWSGQCSGCGAWNSLVEEALGEVVDPVAGAPPGPAAMSELALLHDVDTMLAAPQPTGIAELDRVLGGGIVPGSVTLLGGEPGIGKSTLLLQLLAWWPGSTLYVSAEESAQQVRMRAERLGAVRPDLWLANETTLAGVVAAIERTAPTLVVVDSIQTIADRRVASSPGSVTQVRECAQALVVEAKRRSVPVVLAGHVTKDGTLAGPRVLEHVVDTVLSFEGERHHALRLLRAAKHRFGSTEELGLFEMTGNGLTGVPDPSKLFLADRRAAVAGSVVVPAMEGQRPLLVEVQALTLPIPPGTPARRNAQGLDTGRLALLLAVLERRAGLRVAAEDVYASAVGGVRLVEPGVDLGVAVAVASAATDQPIGAGDVVIGEVGLGGEVRQVAHARRRLGEAARIGFRRAIVPASSPPCDGIEVVRVRTVAEALATVGIAPTQSRRSEPMGPSP